MNTIMTQHEAGLAIAETIRQFCEEHGHSADRLLEEYCELFPGPIYLRERIDSLRSDLRYSERRLVRAEDHNDNLQEQLDAANARIEELENAREEESE